MSTNISILERIFVGSMKHYMKDILNKYNTANHYEFLEFSKNLILHGRDDQILQLFYLEKFFPVFYNNQIIFNSSLQENISDIYLDIEKNLIENYVSPKKGIDNIHPFLVNFGNSKKNILNNLYIKYCTLEDENVIIKVSKVFLINDYKENNWEEICLHKLNIKKMDIKSNSLNFKLLQHLKKYIQEQNILTSENKNKKNILSMIESLPEFFEFSTKKFSEPTSTTSQEKISKTLDSLNINFSREFSRDGYVYDYFLPDLNIVLEYDGPDHFYPLQTQLKEKYKFRHKNITENTKSKVIIIPYYEYLRNDTQDAFKSYLKKMLFKDTDFSKGSLFIENFDMYKAAIRPLL
jgi:hypothetical protein